MKTHMYTIDGNGQKWFLYQNGPLNEHGYKTYVPIYVEDQGEDFQWNPQITTNTVEMIEKTMVYSGETWNDDETNDLSLPIDELYPTSTQEAEEQAKGDMTGLEEFENGQGDSSSDGESETGKELIFPQEILDSYSTIKTFLESQETREADKATREENVFNAEYGEDGTRSHEKAVAINKNNIEYSDKVKETYTDSNGEEKEIFEGYKRNKDMETKKNIENFIKDESDNRSEVISEELEHSEFEHKEEVDEVDYTDLSTEEVEYEFIVLTSMLLSKEITYEEYQKRVSQLI